MTKEEFNNLNVSTIRALMLVKPEGAYTLGCSDIFTDSKGNMFQSFEVKSKYHVSFNAMYVISDNSYQIIENKITDSFTFNSTQLSILIKEANKIAEIDPIEAHQVNPNDCEGDIS